MVDKLAAVIAVELPQGITGNTYAKGYQVISPVWSAATGLWN
jgi:hypothetical protein